MATQEIAWTQPAALANGLASAALLPSSQRMTARPAILRFATDSFMDDVLNLLQASPGRLRDYLVRRETWRGFTPSPVVAAPKPRSVALQRLGIFKREAASGASPAAAGGVGSTATAAVVTDSLPAGTPLKLYQPAHQRHYLVASSLVCTVPGLPDRVIESSRGERVACVIRRLLPPTGKPDAPLEAWEEHGWVAVQQGFAWQSAGSDPARLIEGEERLPLFALRHQEQASRSRRLFAGIVPVGRREAYLGAPRSAGSASPGVTSRTSRKILFRKDVVEPWKGLVRRAQEASQALGGLMAGFEEPEDADKVTRLKAEREQIQTVSWYILLDFATYLATYLKPVWRAVLDPAAAPQLDAAERAVLDALSAAKLSSTLRSRLRYTAEVTASGSQIYGPDSVPTSLRDALARFGAGEDGIDASLRQMLEGVDQAYDRRDASKRAAWPDFLFPLADPGVPTGAPLPPLPAVTLTPDEQGDLAVDDYAAGDPLGRVDGLAVLVVRALPDDDGQTPQPSVPLAAIPPASSSTEGWFVMRCVYERPACDPIYREVMSAPTEAFLMAGFFDPDAPARPIRIGLPIDTTPAGLRKFDKNTAFVISDTLCGQIRRMKKMTFGDLVLSVLPWPFHKDLPAGDGGPCKSGDLSLGMICSLSIPIITLCALLLLIIMVALFDLIFRWLPWFFICFPVPGFKAKKT